MRETNKSKLCKELFQDFDVKNHQINLTNEIDNNYQNCDIEDVIHHSPIQDFYKDQTVFITGATGFLGTLLVEKLLRCCPEIGKLILLVRDRGSTSVEERVRKYFHEDVFTRMRLANPNYYKKVDIVCGQLDLDNFGLSPNDERLMTSQTSIVFHVAATVRFDEHIQTAYNINVKGTEILLSLAKRMPHLKSFVYVSTAYCNCDRSYIDEIFYPPTFTAKELSIVINSSSEEEMAILNMHLLDRKPNTYTLTKAAAEDLVREVVHELPICVFRPSIVFPTVEDPMPLWMKGFNGALVFLLLGAMGLIRVFLANLDIVSDFVPADLTVNALATLAWYQTTQHYKPKDTKKNSHDYKGDNKQDLVPHSENSKIFNYVSYNDNKIKQYEVIQTTKESFETAGESCSKQLWKCHYYIVRNPKLFLVLFYVIHCIPALAFSLAEKLTHRKPLVMKIYRKVFFFFPTMTYFSLREWGFANGNTRSMVDAMSLQDRNQFDASMSSFRWPTILVNMHRSIALYWLKEPVSREYYQKRIVYFEWADFCVWTFVYVIAAYYGFAFAADQINSLCGWSR